MGRSLKNIRFVIRKITLDTSIWIYHAEKNSNYFDITDRLLHDIENRRVKAVFSVVGLTELLIKPKRLNDQKIVDAYMAILSQYENLKIVDVDRIIAEEAAELRAKYNLRTPDAIHLATAIVAKADVFITNDSRLKQVKKIKVIVLKELK